MLRLDMDRVNRVENFADVGMSDPFAPEKGLSEAKNAMNKICSSVSMYDGY
jgi:hypothetical protein